MADKIKKNFDVPLLDLNGDPATDPVIKDGQLTDQRKPVDNINRIIAEGLHRYGLKDTDDSVKIWAWAQLFYKGGDIELERDDYNKIKEISKKMYNAVMVQAQIISLLDA